MPGWLTLACLLVVVTATLLAFLPACDNALLSWDDEDNWINNPHIRQLDGASLHWMWTESLLGVWQPVTWMLSAVQYRLFGGEDAITLSRGVHTTSILLHCVAAALVFLVARRLLALAVPAAAARTPVGLSLGATLAALLFGVHPFRAEVVAWASGQPYVLAMVPALGCLWCYLVAQETRRRRWYVVAIVCLGLSLLCKAMAVPLVGVLLVLDVYPLRRIGGAAGWRTPAVGRVLLEKVPFAVLTLVAAVAAIAAAHETGIAPERGVGERLVTASFCLWFFVGKSLVPVGLAPVYLAKTYDLSGLWGGAALMGLVVIAVVLLLLRRRGPYLLAAGAAYVVVLLPVIGLVGHGGQMAADRYSYLSCLGWALIAGGGLLRLWAGERASGWRVPVVGVAALLVVLLGWQSRRYSLTWRDNIAVWTAMAAKNTHSPTGFFNLGQAHEQEGQRLRRAAAQAKEHGDARGAASPDRDAARHDAAALASYDRALALHPEYPEAHLHVGNMIREDRAPGTVDEAIAHYRTALRSQPDNHTTHFNLGTALLAQRDYPSALEHLRQAEAEARRVGAAADLATIEQLLGALERRLGQPRSGGE